MTTPLRDRMKNVFEKYFVANAFRQRQANRGKLPKWLLFLMPFVFLGVAFSIATGLIVSAANLYRLLHPEFPPLLSQGSITLAQALILFPSLLAGICISVSASNLLLRLIKPIRKILDQNTQGVSGASFKEGMMAGKQLAIFVGLPALVLILLGIWAPWASP
ncbi:MAG: hypothetical protein K0R10_1858 [Alphaproteobacteria bacterium]|nr:hypothetical protein [Alphaproteobacteria bacterium]